MQEGNVWNAIFWCNHDQPRALSRFGDDVNYPKESAKMLGTAMQWNGNKNAGFTEGTPWISVASNDISAAKNIEDKDSVYNYYKSL
ncbi:MAG: alpha-amylase family glycosyl hydrolase [Peptostreptococcaceae bacterium]